MNEGWIVRYFSSASGFSQTNLQKTKGKKDAASAGPKSQFLSHPINPQPLTLKAPLKEKVNKMVLPFSPSPGFPHKFTISKLIYEKLLHPTGNWTQTPSLGVLNQDHKISCSQCASEDKFRETGKENWPPVGIKLKYSRSVTSNSNHCPMITYY